MELLEQEQETKLVKGMPLKEYNHNYYMEHKEKYKDSVMVRSRDWRILNSGQFIYFLINGTGNFVYCGQFYERPIIERLSLHLHGHSNLKIDANQMKDLYNLSVVAYKNFKKYNLNKQDLSLIENYFKTAYINILGKNDVHYDEEELSRSKKELIQIAENEELILFNFNKYLN